MTPRQGFSWSPTLTGTSSRKEDKGGGSWHHILITNNQILRKRGSECQLLHLVGWLSQGISWYGFHNDDPACDRIFRYFLNILSLVSCFRALKWEIPMLWLIRISGGHIRWLLMGITYSQTNNNPQTAILNMEVVGLILFPIEGIYCCCTDHQRKHFIFLLQIHGMPSEKRCNGWYADNYSWFQRFFRGLAFLNSVLLPFQYYSYWELLQ